jgi:hypothetical protein
MTEAEEKAALRAYAARWRRAAPLLEAQRDEDVRRTDTPSAIVAFTRLGRQALTQSPPSDTSGLVEQQRIFRKLRPA